MTGSGSATVTPRNRFEALGNRSGRVLVAGVPAALACGAYFWIQHTIASCLANGPSLLLVELTFSAKRLAALSTLASPKCHQAIGESFLWSDLLFAISYAATLWALVRWVERCFWSKADGSKIPPDAVGPHHWFPPERLASLMALAPWFAAGFDIVGENLPLRLAWTGMPSPPTAGWSLLVVVESFASAIKWTLVGAVIVWIVVLLMSGWRGRVLWRSRFSVLTILLGSVPLLVVDQGQDVLSSIAEDHRGWVLARGVLALLIAGLAAWWCARVLVLIRFANDPPRDDGWAEYFEREIPRMLGVAVLVLGGAAVARASSPGTGTWFAIWLLVVVGVGNLLRWRSLALLKEIGSPRFLGRYRTVKGLPEDLGQALVMVVAFTVFTVWFTPGRQSPDPVQVIAGQYLKIAAWSAVVLAVVLYVFVYYRRRIIAVWRKQNQDEAEAKLQLGYPPDKIPGSSKVTALIAAIASAAFFVGFVYRDAVPAGRWLGGFAIVCLAAANAVLIGSGTVYVGRRYRLPVVSGALALAALFSLWNDGHRLGLLPSNKPPPRPTLDDYFRRWLAAQAGEHAPGDTIPVILVAAAGGGLRAAYWTAFALDTLADQRPAFTRNVFAISGVSGGSLGGAVFAALVRSASASHESSCLQVTGHTSYTNCLHQILGNDFLSPVLAKMLAPDFAQLFIPAPVARFDRSRALERGWAEAYYDAVKDSAFTRGFLGLWSSSGSAGTVPALMLNATDVETGKRIVASPFRLANVLPDAYDLHDMLGADVTLVAAAHNSARFTYVSPAALLRNASGANVGHAVDGGYFENSGLVTVGDLYHRLQGLTRDTNYLRSVSTRLDTMGLEFVLLYLCNDPQGCAVDRATISPSAVPLDLGTEGLGPVRALIHAREARGSLARAELANEDVGDKGMRLVELDVCADSLRSDSASAADSTAAERVRSPPLGWLLSPSARKLIEQSLSGSGGTCREQNHEAMKAIVDRLLPDTGGRN
jgi:hypothetical protein